MEDCSNTQTLCYMNTKWFCLDWWDVDFLIEYFVNVFFLMNIYFIWLGVVEKEEQEAA